MSDVEKDLPPWKEPLDTEPMIYRAKLINEIREWYYKKFKGGPEYRQVSIFDLIADFIMDTRKDNL